MEIILKSASGVEVYTASNNKLLVKGSVSKLIFDLKKDIKHRAVKETARTVLFLIAMGEYEKL